VRVMIKVLYIGDDGNICDKGDDEVQGDGMMINMIKVVNGDGNDGIWQ